MNKLVIYTTDKGHLICILNEKNQLLSVKLAAEENESQVSSVFIGKVKNIKRDLEVAFIEYGHETNGFLKINDNKHIYVSGKGRIPMTQLKIDDEILIQISKDAIGDKGAVLTSEVSMSGHYVVVHTECEHCGISTKIADEHHRKRLFKLARTTIGEQFGFILRTGSVAISEDELVNEMNELTLKLKTTVEKSPYAIPKSCLYKPDPLQKIMVTYRLQDIGEVICDDVEVINRLKKQDSLKDLKYKYYDDPFGLDKLYKLTQQIDTALKRSVWMKSGANVIFDVAEAATIIDINSKKADFKGKKHMDASLKINLEAAELIGKQIMLRNYSGIILIDFIDVSEEMHPQIIEALKIALNEDTHKSIIYGFTQLGLLEMARQKVDMPLALWWK